MIRDKPRELNLLLTGHDDKKEFIDQVIALADLATEMKKVNTRLTRGTRRAKA